MNHCAEVLVVGGGVVGLTAAIAVARQGYSVALLDAGALPRDTSKRDSRVYAINQASVSLLQRLQVWHRLPAPALAPFRHMVVQDSQNAAAIHFDACEVAAAHLGFILEEAVLKQALMDTMADLPNLTLFPGCAVDNVQSDDASVRVFGPQGSWTGQLLLVADGAHSPTRKSLAVEITTWPYHQQAITAAVTTEKPHQQTAYQLFKPSGPLAFLPLAHPNHCSIVWSIDSPLSQEFMAMDEAAFANALTTAFPKQLGQIQLTSPRQQFPLHMRHVKQYTGKRWVLLGDAAHTVHPLAGLGLNLGLSDVHTLMQCIARGGVSSAKQLGAYQRDRKHAVWQTILLMEGFKRLFSTSAKPLTTLRGIGLHACNALPLLKRLFIQHAAG